MAAQQPILNEAQLQTLVAFFELLAEIDAMPEPKMTSDLTTSNMQEYGLPGTMLQKELQG